MTENKPKYKLYERERKPARKQFRLGLRYASTYGAASPSMHSMQYVSPLR